MKFPARRAKKWQSFTYTGPDGRTRTFKPNAKGVVRPRSRAEAAIADLYGLPVVKARRKTGDISTND